MKKLLFYAMVGCLALVALARCRDCATTPRVLAAEAVSPVKGDLVIDFLGGVRGYVEPCG
ncbi:MAG TPA: hypothetical protein VGM51_15615 [Armatimonadota bacterium]|jgi:hypothetical protein